MGEPLKHQFGIEIAQRLAGELKQVDRRFDRARFLKFCAAGYDELELLPRARHIAAGLAKFLPADYPEALAVLLATLGSPLQQTSGNGMAPFYYLPHTIFVAEQGLEHFELSMAAQHQLTQRFTAEFSIRPFLVRYPEWTLQLLKKWARDPNVHVRRLVSEGTRPRLPWSFRLQQFQADPRPVLPLLELLRDDPEIYVRKSVANHLNDISKDHPELVCEIASRWLQSPTPEREWIIRQGLRTLIKQGDSRAFAVLGYESRQKLNVLHFGVQPARARIGEAVTVDVRLSNPGNRPIAAIVDLQLWYRKANGETSPKTFKLKTVAIAGGTELTLSKTISLRQMTTRKHYPGAHGVTLLIHGEPAATAEFLLQN